MIFTCIAFLCIQQMTSTIPDRYDWNIIDQASSTILLVRWISPTQTLNVEQESNKQIDCWIYDGNGDINCP